MARKRRKKNKHDKSLLGLLIAICLIIVAFIYYGMPDTYWTNQDEVVDPTGLSQSYQETFIEKMVPKAQSIQTEFNVLPSIIISQAILESNWGRSELAREENNYFGIKDSRDGALYPTQEYFNEWITTDEPFKVYSSFEESMEDHARLLAYGTSWDPYLYTNVIEANDYQSAAFALQAAGYATDPTYSNKLIRIIEAYELYRYD